MKIIGHRVIFSSGKEKYANAGIVGISPDLNITGGYDNGLYNPEYNNVEYLEACEVLSQADLLELADFMIEQWSSFKTKIESHVK